MPLVELVNIGPPSVQSSKERSCVLFRIALDSQKLEVLILSVESCRTRIIFFWNVKKFTPERRISGDLTCPISHDKDNGKQKIKYTDKTKQKRHAIITFVAIYIPSSTNVMDTISRSFKAKKEKILSDLSLPDEEYTDLSPKGSVDVGIRHLIRDINNLPGLVTTSSCAGRISVFLEGGKPAKSSSDANDGKPITSSSSEGQEEPEGPEDIKIGSGNTSDQRTQFAATGGKGSGRWQYVSHDPVLIDDSPRAEHRYHELFGLGISEGEVSLDSATGLRLARFHFEPMVSLPVIRNCRI